MTMIKANENSISMAKVNFLRDLKEFDHMLIEEEFFELIGIYNKAINRIEKEAREQGIDVSQN